MIISELYRFTQGDNIYYYTSGILKKTFETKTYNPIPISRSNIVASEKSAKTELTIKISAKNEFAKQLVLSLHEEVVLVEIFRNETPIWQGRITSVEQDLKQISLKCINLFTTKNRLGLTGSVDIYCWKGIYSEACRVVKEDFESIYAVTDVDSNVITIATMSEDSEYFSGGIAILNNQTRYIQRHKNKTLYLWEPFTGVQNGDIYLYPGCDLREVTCRDKFNNILNYGGFTRMPVKNIFGPSGLL